MIYFIFKHYLLYVLSFAVIRIAVFYYFLIVCLSFFSVIAVFTCYFEVI